VSFASPNRHICEVVFELGEDVGLKAGGQIDVAEHSLAGMVASLLEGITYQLPKPPSRSTWILETLIPHIRKINAIFAMFRVFSIIWNFFRIFQRL